MSKNKKIKKYYLDNADVQRDIYLDLKQSYPKVYQVHQFDTDNNELSDLIYYEFLKEAEYIDSYITLKRISEEEFIKRVEHLIEKLN